VLRLYIVAALTLAAVGIAWPHGAAQWIADEHARSLSGILCCGEQDCGWISQQDVTAGEDGYHVRGLVHVEPNGGQPFVYFIEEVVPYSEAQPSPTGDYWRCAWPTQEQRKCFFAPPPSM
jgi:hypothetical protein